MNQLVSVTATFSVSGLRLWNSLPFNVHWWDLTVCNSAILRWLPRTYIYVV